MIKHPKKKLIDTFVDTIQSEGAVVAFKTTDKAEHPALLHITSPDIDGLFRIYIWNLSRGGKGRPADEYRIQVPGNSSLIQAEGESTLILGYWSELELFVAFDYSKHSGQLGAYVSLQVREDALHEAVIHGISIHPKDNEERVVVFSKESALTYLSNREQIHNGTYNIESIERKNYIDLAEDEPSTHRYSVTSYGVDYPIDSIVRRIDTDSIYVPPFQRQFVWGREEASRFIESLILGLPVPGVFLAHDAADKLIIVDGQQRLMSLYYFYKGIIRGEKFTLKGVVPDLDGKSFASLSHDDRSRLEYQTIHATVLRPSDPKSDQSSIYSLFERLNTGGKRLTAQEIRASIYYGGLNDLLNELVNSQDWIDIFGFTNDRYKSQELILRFFAFYYKRGQYEKPMSLFLNRFMSDNRNFEQHSAQEFNRLIFPAITLVADALGRRAFRLGGGINAAVFDSVMTALATQLAGGDSLNPGQVAQAYRSMLKDDRYVSSVRAGTSDKASIETRIGIASDYFSRDYSLDTLL